LATEARVNPEAIQKILMPYIAATVLMFVVLAIAAWLMKRDGDRRKAEAQRQSQ
jgi:hypothetical protein